jgi:hypothetical protein
LQNDYTQWKQRQDEALVVHTEQFVRMQKLSTVKNPVFNPFRDRSNALITVKV